jgi:toxin ParE1/3/4
VVNWSQRARADLKAVHDYIAKDSPQNAKVVAREIPAYSWRVLCHLREGQVFIVTLVHKRRHLEPEQIQPNG